MDGLIEGPTDVPQVRRLGVRGLGVRDLVVTYGARRAVDGVDLDVPPGQVLALLGPSGCGKSSLLRAVAGLERPAAGHVTWDGADLGPVPVHRRGFGLLFQDGQLFAHRDVAGNVGYGLPRGAGRAGEVARLLDLVGLPGSQQRDVATLSGGERQRVALARSLAPRPRLLLLDEPLSALDRALRERLATDLRAVLETTGTTAVFVTHDQDEAFAVADRIAVMAAGRLSQVATPAELWRAPASAAVARFLGYEAFLPVDEPAAAPLRAALARGPHDGLFALAPGALVVHEDGVVTGTVRRLHTRRGRTELEVDVPGLGLLTARAPVGWWAQAGQPVRLAVDPTALAHVPD
ncbi:MAG: ABC transporter ATP-binding protein [Cellulomonas sp.]|nr:ABC transporter ATP-binding protein [Cellulomonas sp.]